MPITSQSFTVQNSDPKMTDQLNMALNYLQKSPIASVFLELASAAGVQIGMNPKDKEHYPDVPMADPGRDLFDPATHMVIWNPSAAMEVKDSSGIIMGVQSAALGLLHEIVHSIDPALISHLFEKMPAYGNEAEYTAVHYESMVATELGEVTRENRKGNDIHTDNPTTHTMPTESGLIWTQENEYGVDEYGEHYASPGQTSSGETPDFGSTIGLDFPAEIPNDQGFPDDIPARSGEPVDEPLPNEHDNDPVGADAGADGADTTGDFGGDFGGDYEGDFGGDYEGDYGGDYDGGGEGNDYGGDYGGGGGGGGGCVAIASLLPDGRTAGEIAVGDTMELGDAETMEAATGIVSYSELKEARGYRITTVSGASLVCSDTAPIPARNKGLLTPEKLMGEHVAVRWDEHGQTVAAWEAVTKVEEIGTIKVQHITVGNKCFWAGEKKGAYILHHNLKDAGGGGGGFDWPWDFFDLTANVPPPTDGLLLS